MQQTIPAIRFPMLTFLTLFSSRLSGLRFKSWELVNENYVRFEGVIAGYLSV